ncbi:hypothetical protein CLV47_12342 [Antricoccus suffuscus]|uniref:Uncharacterized protein n=1 Tax=Antricoccus suffuscus TaxID=1629062 RepID=A0A2T0ZEM7_9ACTN|nr:hypothetical protein [Antricoccus suffuscus]PRZ34810.1 hypothetical protein CLV47_12342 [Antricoccus suffuscus]
MTTGLERSRRRTIRIITVAAVVLAAAAGVVGGHYLWPGSAKASAADSHNPNDDLSAQNKKYGIDGTPHGPSYVKNNIPLGYTHDAAGAEAAAVNWVRLNTYTPQMAGDPDARAVTISDKAKPGKVFSKNNAGSFTFPTWVGSSDMTADKGTVRVISGATDDASSGLTTALVTYSVVWENKDWKILDSTWEQIDSVLDLVDQYGLRPVIGPLIGLSAKD